MAQKRLRSVFMRGGTSRGLVFRKEDLPQDRAEWSAIFTAAMGSPDANGRQLDGMGGGYSSVSKVCVVGRSSDPDADVEFTFGQVLVDRDEVDYGANCGNMSSAIGPFALEEGLIDGPKNGDAIVRIRNTNTGKIVVSRFEMRDGEAVIEGPLSLDGVEGSGAPIRLDFMDPGGSATDGILPTGNRVDRLILPNGEEIAASLIDVALPMVFVKAAELGLKGTEPPSSLDDRPELMARLEDIRRAGCVAMGMAPDLASAARMGAAPKIAFVAPAVGYETISGRQINAEDMDIAVRMVSMGKPHKASPLTGALCLAAAMKIEGTIPHQLANKPFGDQLRLGHPSGVVHVGAQVDEETGCQPDVSRVAVYRTARRLFEGNVLYREGGEG